MRWAVGIRWHAGAMRRPQVAWQVARRASAPANGDRGNIMRKKTDWLALLLAAFEMTASAQVDVARYVRKDAFQPIEISPSGSYLVAPVHIETSTAVLSFHPAHPTATARFSLGTE